MYPDASESDFEELEFKSESTTVQKVYKYNDLFIFNMKVSGYKDGNTIFPGSSYQQQLAKLS